MGGVRRFPIVTPEGVVKSGSTYSMQVSPTLTIGVDGVADFPQTHGELVVWDEGVRFIVLKEKGHAEYYNQYNPPFRVPTQFHVFLKLEDGSVVEVCTTPLRKPEGK